MAHPQGPSRKRQAPFRKEPKGQLPSPQLRDQLVPDHSPFPLKPFRHSNSQVNKYSQGSKHFPLNRRFRVSNHFLGNKCFRDSSLFLRSRSLVHLWAAPFQARCPRPIRSALAISIRRFPRSQWEVLRTAFLLAQLDLVRQDLGRPALERIQTTRWDSAERRCPVAVWERFLRKNLARQKITTCP